MTKAGRMKPFLIGKIEILIDLYQPQLKRNLQIVSENCYKKLRDDRAKSLLR